jgi:hypothetical protein
VPCPTALGVLVICLMVVTPVVAWCIAGENYLRVTAPATADVLVLEGWIGFEGCRAAAKELALHPYRYVVVTGADASAHWNDRPGNYADMAAWELERSGVPLTKIIRAPAKQTAAQRTYEMAVAVRQALRERGLVDAKITVFTSGVHARRSRLVFRKTLSGNPDVGVIGWYPAPETSEPWWASTERTENFLKETVAWLAEFLFDSGRGSKPSPSVAAP